MKLKINEKLEMLLKELNEYEEVTEMTDEERMALHQWVYEGNSVHENRAMSYQENGNPSDFLDVYRYESEILKKLDKMTPKERDSYISKLQGTDNPNMDDDENEEPF